jgi:hypothetical protein
MISNNIGRFNQLFDHVSSIIEEAKHKNNLEGKISYHWLFYPVIEQGVELENNVEVVFQTGSTGSTGYVLSYASQGIHVVWESRSVRFRYDERRYIPVTEFSAQSNGSTRRKVREECKVQPHNL